MIELGLLTLIFLAPFAFLASQLTLMYLEDTTDEH